MRVKMKYHYGTTRYERDMSFTEFVQEMRNALWEMPGNDGRERAVFDCLHGLMIDGRGEFGWSTYTLEGN